jgi:SAM-dependent methyltransferase
MPAGWEWDESLFAGAAGHYDRGRLPYAPGLPGAVAALLPPGQDGRLLDVGCGPGTLSLLLAPVFGQVTGLDPDPGMIAEARRRAAAAGAASIDFVQARAEDLPLGLGRFDAAVFGQSFHWMHRDQVAAAVRGMLPPGGLFLHVADARTAPPRGYSGRGDPPPPVARIQALVSAHLGPVRRAGQGLLPAGTPDGEADVLARNGFAGLEEITVPAGQLVRRDADDLVSWVYSLSSSVPPLFGDGLAAFDAELRALLASASPTGFFSEYVPDTQIMAWRRAPGSPRPPG